MTAENLPKMPQRPERPEPTTQHRSSLLSIIFIASLALFLLVALVLLGIIFPGGIFVLAVMFVFIAFPYMIWGWWLSKMIRREDEPGESGQPPAGQLRPPAGQ